MRLPPNGSAASKHVVAVDQTVPARILIGGAWALEMYLGPDASTDGRTRCRCRWPRSQFKVAEQAPRPPTAEVSSRTTFMQGLVLVGTVGPRSSSVAEAAAPVSAVAPSDLPGIKVAGHRCRQMIRPATRTGYPAPRPSSKPTCAPARTARSTFSASLGHVGEGYPGRGLGV